MTLHILFLLIVLALAFDFMNGFHDAANSIATVVSTGVLKPQYAVAFAAFFNFVAYFLFPLKVAATIGQGLIDISVVDHHLVFGALVGATAWNIITWLYGIPSSSSHALVGGLVGAAVAKAGTGVLVSSGLVKTVVFIVLSPMLGFLIGSILMVLVSWIFVRTTPHKVDKLFRRLQLVSASLYSLGHGGNDAQKTMGIISVLLFSQGLLGPVFHVPLWVMISCYLAIAMGTLTGGWRIIETMGSKITRLTPHQGFCAEAGGATVIFAASFLGIPVSTTHT
ncbi:MAG: inorganic phosphate transporter, partial [Betaproteobacteria bacterium]|nr:inorganic phosphate transporter [Betaproteobacteria bacterium]